MSNRPPVSSSQERTFVAKSSVSIFGAPISWVALFGALIGALSIIPFIFYTNGGGFLSAGMGLFAPISGVILGPWAGFVAGTIGGLIGMMISPAAYPLGFVDVVLSGSLLPLAWGLMQPKYRMLTIPLYASQLLCGWLIPYHWPGAAWGIAPASEPLWFISRSNYWLAGIMYFFLAPFIWRWMASTNTRTAVIGLACNMYMALILWIIPWSWPYALFVKTPYALALVNTIPGIINNTIPMVITSTLIGYFLIRAVRKGNLRVVPNSWLDGIKFSTEV